jgi:hypothetical protein
VWAVWAAAPGGNALLAQHARDPAGDLVVFTSPADKNQQLLVIDTKTRVLAVYHVDTASGAVSLRSVRQFHWDLQLAEYNGVNPLPREIRQMIEQR